MQGNDTTPTSTPNKPSKKKLKVSPRITTAKKILFSSPVNSPKRKQSYKRATPPRSNDWSKAETSALTQFVSLHRDKQEEAGSHSPWPGMNAKHPYWTEAALFTQRVSTNPTCREAGAIRSKVVRLRSSYATIDDAEDVFGMDINYYADGQSTSHSEPSTKPTNCAVSDYLVQLVKKMAKEKLIEFLLQGLKQLTAIQLIHLFQLHVTSCGLLEVDDSFTDVLLSALPQDVYPMLLNKLFLQVSHQNNLFTNMGDFPALALKAMRHLQDNNKPNLLYKLAQAIAPQESEPLMALDRMPFGLIQYQLEFFTASHVNQVSIPEDYYQWCETVTSLGRGASSLIKVIRGPMWSGCDPKDIGIPAEAKVNIAFPSYKSLQRRLKKSEYLPKPVIQTEALKALPKDGRYWIKLDGTDLKPALMESVAGVWHGDVNLGDGDLEQRRADYDRRRNQCTSYVSGPCPGAEDLRKHISSMQADQKEDASFLSAQLSKAAASYQDKVRSKTTSQEKMKECAWECVELQELLQQCAHINLELTRLNKILETENCTLRHVQDQLKSLQPDLKAFLQGLFKKKRKPATHALVLLVSSERRIKKPFSIPVQYIAYSSFPDQFLRSLLKNLKQSMVDLGLHVVGTVTDGEFHTLRCQGETRPLHVYQLIKDAKAAAKKMNSDTLTRMLTLDKIDPNSGTGVAVLPNDVIPTGVLAAITAETQGGRSFQEAIQTERQKLVPSGYEAYSFRPGTRETHLDSMRSLVATYRYRHDIRKWKDEGVDFSSHLYVPETDMTLQTEHHERSDHNHLLKRMATATRELKYQKLNADPFDAALLDKSTGLTHAALTGLRKQSVPDAERLLSFSMASFMRKRGHITEAEYLTVCAEWHEASDGRGIHQLARSRANYKMMNYLLEDWIPWYSDQPDLSFLDINRPVNGIREFSYQTVIELTTNIESQEYRRAMNKELGYHEHPRADSTDDVECFFSLVRRHLGGTFTLADFENTFPRIVREFTKRIQPQLPYHYWTLNERYHEEEADFDDCGEDQITESVTDHQYHSVRKERLHKVTVNHREDASIFAAGRAFLPARNRPHIRERLYRPNAGLPPIPEDLMNKLHL